MMRKAVGNRGSILVVEDDPSIAELLELYLGREGFDVQVAVDCKGAEAALRERSPILVILDLMLPDGSGLDVLESLREHLELPVIILTAKDQDQDKILGLELGADDYVTKPFNPGELVARVRAVLRRMREMPGNEGDRGCSLGGVVVDGGARAARVDDRDVELTPKEFDLLHYLLLNRGLALSRERLLEEVWGYAYYGDARTVDVHVRQLRRKLGRWSCLVRTVWGVGYKAELRDGTCADDSAEAGEWWDGIGDTGGSST